MTGNNNETVQEGIAIVGMSGRFPGANDVPAFWKNLTEGQETITRFPPEQLEIPIPESADTSDAGDYVCAKGLLENIDMFDARFFGYLPKEAEVMDPQHRIFLEICSEAIEHAGYDSERYEGAIGVYGGCYMDTYVLYNLCSDEAFRAKLVESIQVGTLQTELGNDKDYLATRVAFKLGLRGPAMTLQTACSTSLVSIATACQSLDAFQCDMALAGGITIVLPQKKGYFYKEGGMLSPDGRCRPFDQHAAGTVFSNGAAVVLLKRLEDAIADNDTVYGVIKGYAMNNDGGQKVSYTAPSVDGQAEVISLALGMGQIEPRTIGYVEAHGTATPLGDPIEIAGLTKAYRTGTDDNQFCAIGSVKANLGHLDCASGAIGLIKTTLALHNKVLPPLLHFTAPNPNISFESSPFYVNTDLKHWPENSWPRRAGISSFGVGGTNAHVVIEEAPLMPEVRSNRPTQILPLSARSESALEAQAEQLTDYLDTNRETELGNVAYTLQQGRRVFDHRRFVMGSGSGDLVQRLRSDPQAGQSGKITVSNPDLVFMFPGQGAQYPGMGRELYELEPVFRKTIDDVSDALLVHDGFETDLRHYLLWAENTSPIPRNKAVADLAQTWLTQPAIFAVEIAVARLLESWGVVPTSVLGHSVGEFAAACHAGIFSLEDAAHLITNRGRLIHDLPAGKMLAVLLPADQVRDLLPDTLAIAAVNAPTATVVSGDADYIDAFAEILGRKQIKTTPLATSHAFHSPMMAAAEKLFAEEVAKLPERGQSRFENLSPVTGGPINSGEYAEPDYWGRQIMQPVLFQEALEAGATADAHRVFVEIGPGQALGAFARQTLKGQLKRPVFTAMGPVRDPGSDYQNLLALVGKLWVSGVTPDWDALHDGTPRRVALPTYPFERKSFWVEPKKTQSPAVAPVRTEDSVARANGSAENTGSGSPDDVEELIKQQLNVISDQLRMLRGQ